MTPTRKHPAFTLVELLVVIAIIGVLIAGLIGIPWSNLTKYAKTSAVDQIETAVGSARMTALERGRRAGVIFTQSNTQDAASMINVVESNVNGIFWKVDGATPIQLPRGTTVRAPAPSDNAAGSLYQTSSSGSNPDNTVTDTSAPGGTKKVKCFAVMFDATGRLVYGGSGGSINLDGNRDGTWAPGVQQPTDLNSVPLSPYVIIIDTRSLQDANVLCFNAGQTTEDAFILNPNNKAKIVTFNRFSGNALRN